MLGSLAPESALAPKVPFLLPVREKQVQRVKAIASYHAAGSWLGEHWAPAPSCCPRGSVPAPWHPRAWFLGPCLCSPMGELSLGFFVVHLVSGSAFLSPMHNQLLFPL
jgi:hypothetical protein